jgi:hypothetical protein
VITFGVVPSVAWPSERVTGWSIRVWTSELRGEYHQGRRMKSSSQRCVRPSNPACPFYASPLSLLSRVRLSSPHGHPTAEAVGGHLFQVASDGTGSHFPSRPSGRDDLSGRSGAAASAGKMRISHSHIPVAWSGISGCRPGTAERLSCKVVHHAKIHL